MSKQLANSLFMFPPLAEYAGFYQELLRGIGSHQHLGNRLIQLGEQAHAFRQFDRVKEIGQILFNFPLKQYSSIGVYFLGVALNSCGNGNQNEAKKMFELVTDTAPDKYKAKAILSLAAVSFNTKAYDAALYFYNETIKATPLSSSSIHAARTIAVLKGMEGRHNAAVKDLENYYPLIKYAAPHVYFDYLNSYAVELGAVGRIDEARNVSRIVLASPFAPAYPEWQDTHADLNLKQKRRSTVTVTRPRKLPEQQPKPKQSKPKDNVIKFPLAERLSAKSVPDENEFSIPLAPLQALGLILTAVLGDRITEDEVEKICNNYYKVIMDWYS
ncbi:MAG: hypothetical protein ACLGJB_27555 [Blastocatellia bacterium]